MLPDEYKFIGVIFEDEKGNSIHRQYIVLPLSETKNEWCQRIEDIIYK